jgi:hypothetical protein
MRAVAKKQKEKIAAQKDEIASLTRQVCGGAWLQGSVHQMMGHGAQSLH